ncbi:MAG: hypothetical protein ACYCSS_02085 [Sulfuriferula sp.]
MNLALATDTDKSSVLLEALTNAGKPLGMNQADLAAAIDRNCTAASRGNIDPASNADTRRQPARGSAFAFMRLTAATSILFLLTLF